MQILGALSRAALAVLLLPLDATGGDAGSDRQPRKIDTLTASDAEGTCALQCTLLITRAFGVPMSPGELGVRFALTTGGRSTGRSLSQIASVLGQVGLHAEVVEGRLSNLIPPGGVAIVRLDPQSLPGPSHVVVLLRDEHGAHFLADPPHPLHSIPEGPWHDAQALLVSRRTIRVDPWPTALRAMLLFLAGCAVGGTAAGLIRAAITARAPPPP